MLERQSSGIELSPMSHERWYLRELPVSDEKQTVGGMSSGHHMQHESSCRDVSTQNWQNLQPARPKMSLKKSNPSQNIFGTEDNNWYTNSSFPTGFFSKKYQDLDFTSPGEKYQTNLTKLGYIASFDINGDPLPITPLANIAQGDPSTNFLDSVVVGAPYHFYFGLNNGKTAINRFYKLYVATAEE